MIPKDSKNGEKIWISELYTRKVQCDSKESEPVYFYYFPEVRLADIPPGMKFGITYNDQDTDLDISKSENQRRIKTNIYVEADKSQEGTVQVQLYIKKSGEINSSTFSGQLNIYQLDGEKRGLNNDEKGPNYLFSLSELNKITEITYDSRYSWRNFNIDINNDLTLSSQTVSNIGNLSLACYADNNFNLTGKRVTLDIYPDKTKSAEKFTTDLAGLNFTFNIAGQVLKPNNGINNPQKVTVSLNNKGETDIPVDGLFKLDYQEPGPDWLYNHAISKVTLEKINIESDLRLIK